jgi:hypothetical protein
VTTSQRSRETSSEFGVAEPVPERREPRSDAERQTAAYLHAVAALAPSKRRYGSQYALVLHAGVWHIPAPLPQELERWRGAEGECFAHGSGA